MSLYRMAAIVGLVALMLMPAVAMADSQCGPGKHLVEAKATNIGGPSYCENGDGEEWRRVVAAILGGLVVVNEALFSIARRKPKKAGTSPAHPAESEQERQRRKARWAAEFYPGFVVEEKDFVLKNDKVYRVNSDGRETDVTHGGKWFFDDKTGEFFWIKERLPDGSVIYNITRYSSRYYTWFSERKWRKRARIGFDVSAVTIAAITLISGNHDGPIAMLVMILAWVVGGPSAVMLVSLPASRLLDRTGRPGPEPLQRRAEDFGASSPEAPAAHPSQDDLAYKPNV